MIFLDTSAIYALADKNDEYHEKAHMLFGQALEDGEEIITHNYVIVESSALIQHRLGLAPAVTFLREVKRFEILWVNEEVYAKAIEYFISQKKRKVSFVDCVSFVLMEQRNISHAFAFDDDFSKAGFTLYGE